MKYIDIRGQRFDRLMVIRRIPKADKKGRVHWICRCDCGRVLVVRGDNLRNGTSTQCSACSGHGKQSIFLKEGDEL